MPPLVTTIRPSEGFPWIASPRISASCATTGTVRSLSPFGLLVVRKRPHDADHSGLEVDVANLERADLSAPQARVDA
jgi:hypothetical protein